MVLETGIFASQAIWLWRVRNVRREAKKVGMTYDQYTAVHPSKKLPRSDSQETVVDIEACHERHVSTAHSEKTVTDEKTTHQTQTHEKIDLAAQSQDEPQLPSNAVVKDN